MGIAAVAYMNEPAVGGPLSLGGLSAGVVTVAHRTATCTCGWAGQRRAALCLARHEAWMHAAITGCEPGVPFVAAR
jgi:hypothetical protein